MKTTRLLSVMMFVSLFIGVSSLFASCHLIGVKGNGNVIKQDRTVTSFNAIDVSGAFDIYLNQGSTEAVTVEADENLLPLIRTRVVDGVLVIDTKDKPIGHATAMKVYITFKDLSKIEISGAVDIETQSKLTLNDLFINTSGASDGKMEMAVQKLKIESSGASKIRLTGMAVDVQMDLSGASDIFAFDFPAETYSLDISGAGKAEINVTKKLEADISGAGTIRYKGSPTTVDQQVSGAGSIRKVE